jgi:hypothetical protein
MSDELNPTGNESGGSDLAASVAADLETFKAADPQAKAAKEVAAALEGVDVDSGSDTDTSDTGSGGGDSVSEGDQEVKNAIAEIFRKRNDLVAQTQAQEAESQAVSQAQKAMQEAQRVHQEAQQLMAQARQAAQWAQQLKSDPIKALQAAGVDPEAFIMQLANEGTPQSLADKKLQEQDRKLKEFEEWKSAQERKAQEAAKQAQLAQIQQFRSSVETEFFQKVESSKHIKEAMEAGLFTKEDLVQKGDSVADQYRQLTGQEASLADIVAYIDSQVGKAYQKLKGTQQVAAPVIQPKPGPSAKKAPVTLSADDASERRSLDKQVSLEMDRDERIKLANKAVSQVVSKFKDTD